MTKQEHRVSGIQVDETKRVSGIRVEVRCPHCHDLFPDHEAFVTHRQKEHPPELIKLTHAGGIPSEEHVQELGSKE